MNPLTFFHHVSEIADAVTWGPWSAMRLSFRQHSYPNFDSRYRPPLTPTSSLASTAQIHRDRIDLESNASTERTLSSAISQKLDNPFASQSDILVNENM